VVTTVSVPFSIVLLSQKQMLSLLLVLREFVMPLSRN
jgi:hypothetical protein